MYTTSKITTITSKDTQGEWNTFSLRGFWSETAVRNFLLAKNKTGEFFCAHIKMNLSKYGLDNKEYEFTVNIE